MKKNFLRILLLLCFTPLWAKVTVDLDTARIIQGKPFRLIITDDNYSQVLPDITPLERDFTISGSEQSTSVTVINNKIQSSTRWVIYLETDKAGKLMIPSLSIGGERTKPIAIMVHPAATKPPKRTPPQPHPLPQDRSGTRPDFSVDTHKDVLLTAEVDIKKPYLNQQVIYTMRLINARRLVDVEFTPPKVKDALMFPLGDGNRYEISRQGKRYAVEEQKYAVFPLKSGKISIEPPQFSALVYDGFPQRVHPRASNVTLEVQPVPSNASVVTWLPATNVELEEEYSNSVNAFKVGNTLIREITIKALGMTGELLPEYTFSAPADVKLYPEKPDRKNYLQNHEVLGTATYKLTYLFNKPGKTVIPAFTVQWFNTRTGKMEEARLPERSLMISGKPAADRAVPVPPNKQAIKELNAIADKYLPKKKSTPADFVFFITFLLLLAALLIIVVLLYFFWQRRTGRLIPTRQEVEQGLKKACQKNDPLKTRDYFIQWAKLRWPAAHPVNLSEAGKLTADQALMGQVNRLSRVIYMPQKQSWSGKEFWEAFENYRRKKTKPRKNSNALPPINPY